MKRLFASLVLIPFLLVPAVAQEPKNNNEIILKKLEDLQKSIDNINSSLRKDVDKNKDELSSLQEQVKTLKTEITTMKAAQLAAKKNPDLDDIRDEIKALRQKLDTMTSSYKDTKALKPPRVEVYRYPSSYNYDKYGGSYYDVKDTKPAVQYYNNPPEVQYGKVKFVNNYNQTFTCDVNGAKKVVAPWETITFDYIMPGTFTYQVNGVTGVVSRTLSPKETFTVTIHPQPQYNSQSSSSYVYQPRSTTYYPSYTYPTYSYYPATSYYPSYTYNPCGR